MNHNHTPLVSILIPCYNAQQWVGDAIRSALAQTWPNKEVIIVDDGSTDDSLAVIRSFGSAIRFETGPNRGGNVARNRLLELTREYFPGELGGFLKRNLLAVVESRGPMQITSIVLLLITANGIFEPLEVALNSAWGAERNRSYWKNQLLSLGLIMICGGLALLSFVLTALNQQYLGSVPGFAERVAHWTNVVFFKFAAVPISILALFLVYWLLPNRRVPPLRVAPVAILVGVGLEMLKYLNLLTWPFLKDKLQKEYGPFYISVTIVLFSFIAAMLVLAGAEWAARENPDAGPALLPVNG